MKEKVCANCEEFIGRGITCVNGMKTIVPYNVSCGEYKEKEECLII